MQTSDKVSDPENEDNQTPIERQQTTFLFPFFRSRKAKFIKTPFEQLWSNVHILHIPRAADGGINWFSVIWGGMTGISSHSINAVLFDYCLHF